MLQKLRSTGASSTSPRLKNEPERVTAVMQQAFAPISSRPFELSKPDLSAWRGGNTGIEGVWRFDSHRPGREVLVSALVHGNELFGAWALLEALQAGIRPACGALTLAFCNLAAFDRFDPLDTDRSRFVDQDFNRLWGSMPWKAAGLKPSCEQARALELQPVVERADWLLDLHSMHAEGPPLGLTGLRRHHAEHARAMGGPLILVADAGHAAGARMRDHGRWSLDDDLDAVSLLVECGWHGALSSRVVALEMLHRFLVASGCVQHDDLPPRWLAADGLTGQGKLAEPHGQHAQHGRHGQHKKAEPGSTESGPATKGSMVTAGTVLHVSHAITVQQGRAPTFTQDWQTGQSVARAGTVIGHDGSADVITPYDHCVLVMPSLAHATPGATMVRFARVG